MERICCPVVLSEELTAVFKLKNILNWHRPKKLKIFQFSKFLCNYRQFSTDFVNWNVEKSQHGTNLLSSRLFQRVNCSFQVEKYLKLAPTQKTQNFPIFKVFMQFLSHIRQTS